MSITIVRLNKELSHHLPHKQQPFSIIGKFIPTYDGKKWRCTEELLTVPQTKIYPDEEFDPAEYVKNPNEAAFLAMDGENCVGSIRVCTRWNGDAFIDDLALDQSARGKGAGRMLMDAVADWAKEKKMTRISLETQDDNLIACRFYLKYGFELGGIDVKSYTQEAYREEIALYFYKNL